MSSGSIRPIRVEMKNLFKEALAAGKPQLGCWLSLANAYTTEIVATAAFDWLLIDGEHAPNDLRSTLAQLQAVAAYPSHPVVRAVEGRAELIKQLLDIGAQTLLIPMIETAGQAEAMVAATRYPPNGVRGVGSEIARVSRWGMDIHYLHEADASICLLLQVESQRGLDNLDAIAATEGVDGVFFGPADLSASMGFRGNSGAPEVQRAIEGGIARVLAAGKAPGILTTNPTLARRYLQLGATFVAVGVDVALLAKGARDLAASYK